MVDNLAWLTDSWLSYFKYAIKLIEGIGIEYSILNKGNIFYYTIIFV